MKKYMYLVGMILLIQACGAFRTLEPQQLRIGMSRWQVIELAGYPERVLTVSETDDGLLEVLEYHTNNRDVYALEFWDDYLTGYQFLYNNVQYVPSLHPPVTPTIIGQPLPPAPKHPKPPKPKNDPIVKPGPGRPGGDTKRPADRPGSDTRRPSDGTRPSKRPENVSSERPAEEVRPSERPGNTQTPRPGQHTTPATRPESGDTRKPAENVRPTERPVTTDFGSRSPHQTQSESGSANQSASGRR